MNIVEQLRTHGGNGNTDAEGVMLQAAAALEHYHSESARLRALLTETGQKAIEAAAENERLRAALKRITNCAWSAPGAWDAQDIAREALGK